MGVLKYKETTNIINRAHISFFIILFLGELGQRRACSKIILETEYSPKVIGVSLEQDHTNLPRVIHISFIPKYNLEE